MRTCMYCGRELAAGEVCNCPQSVLRRGAKTEQKNQTTEKKTEQKKEKTTYKTGYAGTESRFEQARNRYNAKRAAKKNKTSGTNFIKDLWDFVVSFIKSPADSIANPKQIGFPSMIAIAALTGALLWLCIFFILRGGIVGPFKFLASAMSFGGFEGYKLVGSVGLVMLSGLIGGIVIFFIYTGIFYLIHRFLMRMTTPYRDLCVRLVAAWIPFGAICLIGTLLSILSPITLAAFLAVGAIAGAVLTYEGLKTEWYSYSPTRVLYGMMLGYSVFIILFSHLMFIG